MTGNTVRSMSFLADLEFEKAYLFHAALLVSYVAGGGLFSILEANVVTCNKANNKLPNYSKSTHRLVAGIGLALFCWSDLLNKRMANARAGLPILTLGYGMINAATLNVVEAFTNAITGHWIKVGLGVGDYRVDERKGGSSNRLFPTTSAGCIATQCSCLFLKIADSSVGQPLSIRRW